jgi:hypothetical protein
MKYLCLAYEEEIRLNSLSRSEWDLFREENLGYLEELRNRGHVVHAEALQNARNAATVSVRNGKVSITDGSFAETKEQLGGFYLINARDLNEALLLASRWPAARFGNIEVWPIEEGLEEAHRWEKPA